MKNWPFNTGDCLMQVAFMTGLTVLGKPHTLSKHFFLFDIWQPRTGLSICFKKDFSDVACYTLECFKGKKNKKREEIKIKYFITEKNTKKS